MRHVLRTVAERVLTGTGLDRALRRGRRGRVLVLAYHNVVPDGLAPLGDGSLHLPQSRFEAQLDRLGSEAAVIGLADLAAGRLAADRPNVVITFDDAYRGALSLALPSLARRGLAATVFVPPGLLGSPGFWWDQAAALGRLDERFRHHALTRLGGDRGRVLTALGRVPDLPPELGVASEAELAAAGALPGVTFGAHSWSHPNLVCLPDPELRAELTRPLQWLTERFGSRTLSWVAWPYGLAGDRVVAAAVEAGYQGGLRVTGGWWPGPGGARSNGPRYNVPAGLTPAGLSLRLAGIGV